AGIWERTWPGLVALARRRRPAEPGDFLYLVPALLFAGTYLASAGFLDRYWVPLLPFLIAGGLAQYKGGASKPPADDGRWTMDDGDKPGAILTPIVHRPSSIVSYARMALFALVAAYGIASHLDDYDSVGARWQA